jgi:hypothetical protein
MARKSKKEPWEVVQEISEVQYWHWPDSLEANKQRKSDQPFLAMCGKVVYKLDYKVEQCDSCFLAHQARQNQRKV